MYGGNCSSWAYNQGMSAGFDMLYGTGMLLVGSWYYGFQLLKTGKWRTDWPGKFGYCDLHEPVVVDQGGRLIKTEANKKKRLLIHAVSVGEINATRELIPRLMDKHGGDLEIIISVTTNTGYARAVSLFGGSHVIVRFPLDFGFAVNRFLDTVKPDVVATMELEVWPNFVEACVKRKIKTCVINGRLSENSFKNYYKFRKLLTKTFKRLTSVCVQTQDYADRFEKMGVDRDKIVVADSMKWDTAQIVDAKEMAGAEELAKAMGIDRGRKLIVAGSTGPGEEALLIEQCPLEAQLLIVPRKPERFEQVAKLRPDAVRRSEHPDGTETAVKPNQRVFLLDTMGELGKAYALADVCVVGRSFVKMGGSDPIEPIGIGKAVVIGPYHSAFSDVVGRFQNREAIIVSDDLAKTLPELLSDPKRCKSMAHYGRKVIKTRRGATDRNVKFLVEMLGLGVE